MESAILQVFYAIFSGALLALSIPNDFYTFGSPLIALFSICPLYIAAYGCKTYKRSGFLFSLQILTVHLISSWWLVNFRGYAVFTLGASAAGTAFFGWIIGIIFHIFPHRLNKTENKLKNVSIIWKILWFCAIWILWEYSKSNGILAYPWGTVSIAAYRWRILTQIADITGIWGISFIYVLFSCLIAECIINLRQTKDIFVQRTNFFELGISLKFTFIVFAGAALYGAYNCFIPRVPEKEFNAVIIQQNCDPWEAGEENSILVSKRLTERCLKKLESQGEKADIVLWSEGVLEKSFPDSIFYYKVFPEKESLHDFIKRTNTPFIIGGDAVVDKKHSKVCNSAVFFDAEGEFAGFYGKKQLVPFAEKIPLYDNPLMKKLMDEYVGLSFSYESGFQNVVFSVPIKANKYEKTPLNYNRSRNAYISLDQNGLRDAETAEKYIINKQKNPVLYVNFTTPICFEDAFPSVCRDLYNAGSQVFMNITNDSWSKTDSSEIQHFVAASYRSIEFRTTLVRCTNSGYSAVIGPDGAVIYEMPLFEEYADTVKIPVYEREKTVYSVFGDWFAYIMIICIFVYIIFVLREDKDDYSI